MREPLVVKPGEPTRGVSEAVAPPARGFPSAVPITDRDPKCWKCRRRLGAYFTRPWELMCHRCHAINARGDAL